VLLSFFLLHLLRPPTSSLFPYTTLFRSSNSLLTGSYQVFELPLESPLYGSRTIVTNAPYTTASPFGWHDTNGAIGAEFTDTRGRSEEHTSELQSRENLVCRLLLEKKKKM